MKLNIGVIVLAAGQSSRMGKNKALLKYGGKTFLDHVAQSIIDSDVARKILVVTGNDRSQVESEVSYLVKSSKLKNNPQIKLKTVFNPDFSSGLMGSLQKGLRSLGDAEHALVFPVDLPLVKRQTIKDFIKSFFEQSEKYSLGRPEYRGQPGHPCLISREHFAEILKQPHSDSGARFLFQKYPDKVYLKAVVDPGVIQDIDTPQDYEEFSRAR